MWYRANVDVRSGIDTKHISTMCGQTVHFLSVNPAGAPRNQYVWKSKS